MNMEITTKIILTKRNINNHLLMLRKKSEPDSKFFVERHKDFIIVFRKTDSEINPVHKIDVEGNIYKPKLKNKNSFHFNSYENIKYFGIC